MYDSKQLLHDKIDEFAGDENYSWVELTVRDTKPAGTNFSCPGTISPSGERTPTSCNALIRARLKTFLICALFLGFENASIPHSMATALAAFTVHSSNADCTSFWRNRKANRLSSGTCSASSQYGCNAQNLSFGNQFEQLTHPITSLLYLLFAHSPLLMTDPG